MSSAPRLRAWALGVLELQRANLDFVEIANERQQSEMLSRLHAGTDNGGDPAVGPREQLIP